MKQLNFGIPIYISLLGRTGQVLWRGGRKVNGVYLRLQGLSWVFDAFSQLSNSEV
jgi:hypothetical protein